MINWKVRAKNKMFWITLVPAILILLQALASVFGISLDLGTTGNRLIDLINALFTVLAILGVVTDPTTVGITDSVRAMNYKEPR